MKSSFPSIFVSHGAPDLLLQSSPARDFLSQLGTHLGRPKAVLCISAHWLTPTPVVSAVPQPQTIHDFYGFPSALYQLRYAAPGAPELAIQVNQLLADSGVDSQVHPNRGLDHGAWAPLKLMYPDAEIPVTQLSLQLPQGTAHHLKIGRILEPLRREGVLIMGSGSITHNLQVLREFSSQAEPPSWVSQFDQWLADALLNVRIDDLLNYRQLAPYAAQNHPSEEHLLPLFVAMGAGGSIPKVTQLHSSFTYGVLSMAAYAFD
ncbi:MAG: class III extradiol ring-cleavage dioxygenase [Leptolyngbyaceae bacterium]|nr:class III extradiol ring-cleavage dioxygenase [Leptolyngbyaceae bacterium]